MMKKCDHGKVMRMRYFSLFFVMCVVVFLSGCAEEQVTLSGNRIAIISQDNDMEEDSRAPIVLVPDASPQAWMQWGGNSYHVMGNLSLSSSFSKIWSSSYGDGGDRDTFPLLSAPVVGGGYVFTMDVNGRVCAFDINQGDRIWCVDLNEDNAQSSFGGGIAYKDGSVYAVTGFGSIVSLNALDGTTQWRNDLHFFVRVAPVVANGRLVISGLNNQTMVLDAQTGGMIWSKNLLPKMTTLLGGSGGAAIQGDRLITVYSSGDIVAYNLNDGSLGWRMTLVPSVTNDMMSLIPDIRATPVIDGNMAYVVSNASSLVALDVTRGTRVWEKRIRGIRMPWVAGNYVYVLTTDARLIAMDKKNGFIRWISSFASRLNDNVASTSWFGPVMAGGHLLLVNSQGMLVALDPTDGSIVAQREMSPMNSAPVIAGGVLLLQSTNGDITAYH